MAKAGRSVGALRSVGRCAGLLGLPWLRQPRDLLARAEHVRVRCDALVAEAVTLPPSVRVLHVIDKISESLCSALDVAAFVQSVHPEPEWTEAGDGACALVGATMAQLNTDRRLYDALQRVRDAPAVRCALTEEQARFVELLSADFEADGVKLPAARQARVHELHSRISRLSSTYMGALARGSPRERLVRPAAPSDLAAAATGGSADGPLWVRSELLRTLPAHVRSSLIVDGALSMLPDDPAAITAVLKWCADEPLRAAVYRRSHSAAVSSGNLNVLAELLDARLDLARELGFSSHAQMAMAYGRMARCEAEVHSFLDMVDAHTHAKLRTELDELAAAKRRSGQTSALAAWDVPLYTGQLKASRWQIAPCHVAQFFQLDAAVSGLSTICSRLFGLSLHEQPLQSGEAWAPGVRKFALVDLAPGGVGGAIGTGREVGTIFLDLFARERKQPLCATFTLSAGSRRAHFGTLPDDGGTLPLPTVAIVCSFAAQSGDGPTLLAHPDLVTLHHELGHALHALLSRTELHHLSGVRGPLDFVECPSLLLERFATDASVLRTWATHVRTGEPIPERLVDALRDSAGDFVGFDTAQQLLYARVDLAFHGPQPPSADTTTAVRALHERAYGAALPWVDGGSCWHAAFSHLIGYSGGYYSYLCCGTSASPTIHSRRPRAPTCAGQS